MPKVLDTECLKQTEDVSLQIIETMDAIHQHRTQLVEEENSQCSADTTDAEVEELSSGHEPSSTAETRADDVVTPPLPEGCQPLSHQVAGHIHGKGKTKAGLLQDWDGTILKPIQNQSRGKREKAFYYSVFTADQPDPVLSGIRPFIPQFHGTYINPATPDLVYLRIDDVTKKFRKPCIMDVKMGLQSYEDSAPPEKVKAALLKYPFLKSVGFQILGMRVYHPATGEYEYQDKYYGRSLDQSRVIEGLARYFNVGENFRADALKALLVKLVQIRDWFEGQQQYHFFSSSLLVVYEGDIAALTPAHDASGDAKITNSACNKTNSANLVSYSTLAINDSESILNASRDLKAMSNNVDRNEASDTNGYGTRLPSYKEAVQVSRLMQNCEIGVNGDTKETPSATQEVKTQSAATQGGSSTRGVTVAQMREMQLRLRAPYNNNQSASLSNGVSSSDSSTDWLNVNGSKPPQSKVESSSVNHSKQRVLTDIKMIDFTHVVDVDTTDEGYLVGLRNLIQQCRTLLECHQ